MKERSTAVDMVQGPLVKNIIRFAMPVMLSALLEMLFNAADTIIVGKFSGQHALAAVGATGSIIFLITSLFNGLSSGTNVVIARYLGASENDKVQKAVHTAIFTALVGGIFVLAVGFLSTNAFLRGMSTPDDIIDSSALYMHIYWFGAPFILLYDFGAAILRSRGDTKRPFYFLTIAGILNVLLNLLFVIGFRLSVAGVAIATVLSQMMACFLMLRTLLTEEPLIRLYPKKIALHKEILLEIIKIGVPAGIQGLVFSFSNIVIQSEINKLGSIVVAGNSAASNIENFVYIGMIGFSQAAITFTSQNLGAKKITRIKNTMLDTLLLNCVSTFLIALIITSFSGTFLSFYTNDMGVIEAGSVRLQCVAFWLWLNGALDIFVGSLRGMGKSFVPTLISLVGICGVRLSYIASIYPIYGTLRALYYCFPISWVLTGLVQGVLWIIEYRRLKKRFSLGATE